MRALNRLRIPKHASIFSGVPVSTVKKELNADSNIHRCVLSIQLEEILMVDVKREKIASTPIPDCAGASKLTGYAEGKTVIFSI